MARSKDSRASRRSGLPAWTALLCAVLLAGTRPAQADIVVLAVDPDTPTTLYAASRCYGVLKSLDGADSWNAVNDGLTGRYISALAINPATPSTLYVGMRDDATNGGGVFRSTNGGSSWSAVNAGLTTPDVVALAIDPITPTTLYAGTSGAVFRSTNGGTSWSVASGDLSFSFALAINPATPTTLYAGTGYGVYRSLNGGSNWSAVNTGLTYTDVLALAIDPTTPTTLYVGTSTGSGGGGVFRSTNGGSSWSAVNTGLTFSNDRYVRALAIDPTTPTTLYAGTNGGVFRSTNGGNSWSVASGGLTPTDVLALAINPATPTTLYVGTDTVGVFRSLDGGRIWQATGLGHETCGDGFAGCGKECDDGGESATCDADCTFPQCGDGTLNVTAGEQCDDGNHNPFDGCTNDCTVCGNGVVTPPEECDDGNTSSGDGCDAQCRRPRVVGTGTPESCPETAFAAALAERSVIFNCGPDPVTITLTSEKTITAGTTIDGAGRITLSGGGAVGIFTVDASAGLELRNLTIVDGRAEYDGGGIANGGTLTVTNSTFSGNRAGDIGGAIANGGTLTVTNSTFSGNRAVQGGGALFNAGGTATLTNCTLSENGGAIASVPPCSPFGCGGLGSVKLTNTIIAESAGLSCGATDPITVPITDGGHNLQWPGTSCGETIPSLDPLLDPAGLKDNGGPTETIALLPGSPAIDMGDPDVCANPPVNGVDQRGYVRPGTGSATCSIGAFEYNSPGPPVGCAGDCNHNGAVTITELITLVNVALDTANVSACMAGDANSDGAISIDEIIRAVNAALNGCGAG